MVLIGGIAIGLRLEGFGRYGFWTDEVWVALSTRVSASQYWLAISITPVLWAVLLKAISVLPGPPEVVLRLLPLAGSLLTVWGAGRLATNLDGPIAGLLAAAVVAVDPLAVQYAKQLKPYSVESYAALTALAVASRFLRTRAPRDLRILTVVLIVGVGFSSAQLLVGPPILAALLFPADTMDDGDAPPRPNRGEPPERVECGVRRGTQLENHARGWRMARRCLSIPDRGTGSPYRTRGNKDGLDQKTPGRGRDGASVIAASGGYGRERTLQ